MSDFFYPPLWSEYCDSCPGPSFDNCLACEHSFYCHLSFKEEDFYG